MTHPVLEARQVHKSFTQGPVTLEVLQGIQFAAETGERIAAVGMLLRDAAEEGLAVFDFLQGNESYKYMLGAVDAPVYRTIATR